MMRQTSKPPKRQGPTRRDVLKQGSAAALTPALPAAPAWMARVPKRVVLRFGRG